MINCRPPCRSLGLGNLGVCLQYDESGNCTISEMDTPATPTPAASTGFNWDSWVASLIGGAAKTTEGILTAQNQTKGVYTQTGPNGTITYVQPSGNAANIFGASSTGITGSATGSSSMGLILVGGAALLLVFLVARK